MAGSSTTCCGGWLLTEKDPGPLPRPGLKLTGVFFGVLAVGLLIAMVSKSGNVAMAEVGAQAPDFTVPLIDGGSFTLSDQLKEDDRPIVLNLWASWCIPCRVETPDISEFAKAHPEIKVIGVAVDDSEPDSRRFADEFQPSYDLAIGDDAFETAYPAWVIGLPITYLIDPNGRVSHINYGIVSISRLEELIADAGS